MAFHVGLARDIIRSRGKEASRTPLGRALFAAFFRLDIAMSVMMGNPVFLDESWWRNDPLTEHPLTSQTPIVILADAALSRLTVIIAKLTLLRQSAALRRQKMFTPRNARQEHSDTQQLETKIREQVGNIEGELEQWHRNLPSWFSISSAGVSKDHDATLREARPAENMHPFIPIVLSVAYAAKIQLWRIANQGEQTPPPHIFAIIHNLVSMFPQIPQAADLTIIPGVWIAGMFLQDTSHRVKLEKSIHKRIESQDFFLWRFCHHGLIHGWASSEGKDHKPFISLPDDAQEFVPGVSENMWRAEGVMDLVSVGAVEEGEGLGRRDSLYRFKGDTKLRGMESDSDEFK
jgi:hypothetical protein